MSAARHELLMRVHDGEASPEELAREGA